MAKRCASSRRRCRKYSTGSRGGSWNAAASGVWNHSRPASRSGPLAIATSATSLTPRSSSTPRAAESWPAPPSISTRSGQSGACAVGFLAQRAAEAALQHLAHHGEVVARGDRPADGELAVGRLHEPLRPGDDHHPVGVGAHDVAVVVDLDPVGRRGQAEQRGDALQQLGLAGGFRQLALQRLARVQSRRGPPRRAFRRAAAPGFRPCGPPSGVGPSGGGPSGSAFRSAPRPPAPARAARG